MTSKKNPNSPTGKASAAQSTTNSSNNTDTIKKKIKLNPSSNMMYGDIVIGLWWSIVVPVHGRDLWMMDANDPLLSGARVAYLSLVVACILSLSSVFTGKLLFSRLAFFANVFAMSAVNLLEFPFPGECAITPMMVGGTVIGVLANASLPFTEKMFRLPVYFAAGSYVCIHSPYCNYTNDTRPILGGAVLLEMTALYVAHFGGLRKLLNQLESFEMNVAHLARLVLAMLFLHHLTSTLLQLGHHGHHNTHPYNNNGTTDMDLLPPETPVAEHFFVLVQAAVIACVGVAATGAFQEEINSKQRAERKAKEESMMSKAMADSMMVLTHELRTPLQGIMGATSMLLQKRTDIPEKNGDDESESLKLIMASSGLLLNLINNMLDVRRVTEGMMEDFPLTLFPASNPIRDAIGFCLPLASISNVSVLADYASNGNPSTEQAVVRSNALRLQQVLINLISNAIKYTNADGDSKSVIRVSLRTTTVEDVNWHMKRALASSRPEASRHTLELDTEKGKNGQTQTTKDRWATKRGDEKFLLFGVSDCGPGIDKVQANRLFRRFGRLDNKPKRTLGGNKVGQPSGTGLGLHLCQLFVQRMDGQIWASNNKNAPGATFFFCLPLGIEKKIIEPDVRNLLVTKQLPTKPRLGTKKNHRNWGVRFDRRQGQTNGRRDSSDKYSRDDSRRSCSNKSCEIDIDGDNGTVSSESSRIPVFQRRVLVVDDTLINRKILDRMLKQIGLTKLATVGSGQAALKELYKHRYDLVITDLQMPGMSGMELSEAIHNIDDEFFQTPVVVGLTADTSLETVEQCKCSGMLDVIHKPITVEELKEFFERRISFLVEQNQNNEFLEP